MTNKQLLRILILNIKNYKPTRKESSPLHDDFDPWKLKCMSHEARERSIGQALLNRKSDLEAISSMNSDFFERFLAELGIEQNLREDTIRLNPSSIIKLIEDEG